MAPLSSVPSRYARAVTPIVRARRSWSSPPAPRRSPARSRLDLVRKNTEIFRGMIPQIAAAAPNTLLLIVANPVDILTYAALKFSGFPAGRVVGSGTVLDTARLRALIGQRLGIDPRSVHGYVIGEHGDSEVVLWSRATVAGLPISEFCAQRGSSCDSEMQDEIATQVLRAAYEIIERKGATYLRHRAGHPQRRRGHAARPKHRTDRLDPDDRSAWRRRHLPEPALRRGSRGCRGRARARDERRGTRGLSPFGAGTPGHRAGGRIVILDEGRTTEDESAFVVRSFVLRRGGSVRAVIQRVSRASVTVDGQIVGAIGRGFLVLLGVTHDDGRVGSRLAGAQDRWAANLRR